MRAAAAAPEQAVPGRGRRVLILCVTSTAFLMTGLDTTALNIALPSIQDSFHTSLPGLQWVVDAYTLVLASLLMLAGSTADRFGRRRVFQTGQVLFTLGSLLCALAPDVRLLIVFRVVQAVGGTMLNPVSNAIARDTFRDPRDRARAFGVMGAMAGLSMALGPVLGGFLVAATSWRVIFLINLPVGVAAVVLTALFVPDSRAPQARRFDPVGQLLVIAGLASLTYGIIEGGRLGFGTARIVALLVCSAGCLVTLVLYELRRREPLLEVRFFTSVPFSGAIASAVCQTGASGGFLFVNTLYLQEVRGLSALDTALCMLPMAAIMAACAPVSGRLTARHGPRPSLTAGGLATAAGGLMLVVLAPDTPVPYLLGAYVMLGLGAGLVTPPITNISVSLMPPEQAGVAAAVTTTGRQSGQTLGVALFGAVAGSGSSERLGSAFVRDSHPLWWIVAAVGAGTVLIDRMGTTRWARRTARRAAERLGAPEGPTATSTGKAGARVGSQRTGARKYGRRDREAGRPAAGEDERERHKRKDIDHE
jgi:EmrB/QacA subfamily drug resistance transporter